MRLSGPAKLMICSRPSIWRDKVLRQRSVRVGGSISVLRGCQPSRWPASSRFWHARRSFSGSGVSTLEVGWIWR
jgi:hypothetical protein